MNRLLTKKLTMGAVSAAFFVIVYSVFAIDDSTAQEVISLLAVAPVAVYTYMYGLGAGLLSMLACIGLSVPLVQPVILVIYAVPTAIIGTMQGFLMKKIKLIPTVSLISVFNLIHFIYELFMTKWLMKIDVWEEYRLFINKVTYYISFGNTESALGMLAHDMTLCSVPILFVLGAIAKACIYYIVLAVIMKRIFKQDLSLYIPEFSQRDRIFAYAFIISTAIAAGIIALTVTEIIPYSFIIAVLADSVLVFMYVYLVYSFRGLGMRVNMKSVKGIILTLIMILFFPITDCVFAVLALKKRNAQ